MAPPKKDKFEDLSNEFKDKISQGDVDVIKAELANVNAHEHTLIKEREDDEDLKAKKEQAKDAGATYREGLKDTKLKRAFINRVLQDKGKVS